ncbi:hypothetical protein GCM10011594_41690 [Nakamurella endophytica]|uniref:Uncharacterized protein n=1 Tax=Nakamurella endophytica TaxID=1748367 RepID=A0A917TBX0_9ACTN|nr:hypothetical protein GCM10011594_41690 [Nakamurella endophytica]
MVGRTPSTAALYLATCCGVIVLELPDPGQRWRLSEALVVGALGVIGAAAALTLIGLLWRPQWRRQILRTPPKTLPVATAVVLVLAAAALLLWLLGPRTADVTDRAGIGGYLAFGMTLWWDRFFAREHHPEDVSSHNDSEATVDPVELE